MTHRALITALCALAAAPLAALAAGKDVYFDVPYVATPPAVVSGMLKLAGAGPNDVVYDLGSGDGRIVIAAARDFKVKKGIGIDLDPWSRGRVGQVILFGRDEDVKAVLADSLGTFLGWIAGQGPVVVAGLAAFDRPFGAP